MVCYPTTFRIQYLVLRDMSQELRHFLSSKFPLLAYSAILSYMREVGSFRNNDSGNQELIYDNESFAGRLIV